MKSGRRELSSHPRRIALVTQGYRTGGGISTAAHWLRRSLESTGNYSVDVHDLAASRMDTASRRLAIPKTWLRRSLTSPCNSGDDVQHWGANAVEVEIMRYRPRAELTRALREYDLIQVVSGGPALAAAVVKTGLPIVLQVATTAAWERESQLVGQATALRVWRRGMTALTSRVEHSAILHADVVLVLNDAMLHSVRALGQPNVVKAPPGVDTDRFVPGPDRWKSDGYLLSVCRLGDARKGLSRMILAYSKILQIDANVPKLILAGKGDLDPAAVKLIRSLGLMSRVLVRSDVEASDLVRLYQGASIFLLTSHEEGLGVSVLEAMACGLPVVCTDTAGTRETVENGATGWLVPQGMDNIVADEVARRVLATLDGNGATMGELGRARCIRMFSLDITLRRLTDAYDTLFR